VGFSQDDDGPDYSYYIATAVPGESLQSILKAASPIREDGRLFYGHTDWHVQWKMWWSQEPNGQCKISKVTQESGYGYRGRNILNAGDGDMRGVGSGCQ